jgi:hypothetical protein
MTNHDNGTGSVLDALLADRAKQEASESSMAARPNYEKVVVVDCGDENLCR